ncbi:MAG: hypothetical protein DCF12_12305 [Snowella sp.]|nr:MAG: hypothetical protein DCF12_12305 [Snowella sp.]
MTNSNTNYHPLLPKTTQDFSGGSAAGEWKTDGVPLFNRLGNSLDFESGNHNEINSIPSPWSRALQFISAMRNSKYPSREWLIAQYRGFLAAIALSENLKLPLQAIKINLKDHQRTEFGRCLEKLKPNAQDNVFAVALEGGPWSQLYLFESEGTVLGFTSPATLVVPTGYLRKNLSQRIPWVKGNFFADPIKNGLTQTQKEILAPWLQNLKAELLKNPVNEILAGRVGDELENFLEDLNVSRIETFQPTERAFPFGEALAPVPLTALIPAKVVEQESNVKVLASRGLNPAKPLYIIDPNQLPAMMGRDIRDINVIGSSALANFDRSLHQNVNGLFLFPDELFTKELFYTRSKGLLPGTWLDRKLNLDNLTIFLPLNSILKEYFTSQDLETQVQFSSINTPEGPGVKVTLGLTLSGFEEKTVSGQVQQRTFKYRVTKDFPLRAENEIKTAFPTLALWPNVPPGKWKEYFVLVETSEDFGGLAFKIEQPTDKATQETRRSGQESYQYWKCDRYPEILSAIDGDAQFLGLLPLSIPKVQASSAGTWTVGVDFGTSLTNVYIRKGNSQPERLKLQTNLLKITKGLEEIQALIYREFFVPETFLPEGNNPPLASILTTRGWQESVGQILDPISNARIYVSRLDVFDLNKDYFKTNIKWQKVEYQRPFLGQLLRLIAAQAASENVHTIDWGISYPSAFSRKERNGYANTWTILLEKLTAVTGQIHKLADYDPIRTESIAFAQFFADVLNKNLIHTTCVDIGGGTSDISIWQENTLIHQASVPYAGRDIFHRILQPNLAFVGDIFGLSPQAANSFHRAFSGKTNFNAAFDTYLRFQGERLRTDSYVINVGRQRNREFRTLVAFALGALYHYLGLVQKQLNQEGTLKRRDDVTSILVGGNGSRFLHWLSTSGQYDQNSEINILLDGILTKASGLKSNPDLMTISTYPKDEACGGLVVSPDGEKLKGLDQKQEDYPFLGEACEINGQSFTEDQRLNLPGSWENIEDFRITSFNELERYIANFNTIITDEKIEEIDPLRNFGKGGLFSLTDDLRTLLRTSVTQVCLRKKGPITEFEPEPPFLLTIKSLLDVLADRWSKTVN